MGKYSLLVITTFRKKIEYEGDSLEDAIDRAGGDPDVFYSATDTLDFDTDIVADEKVSKTPWIKVNRDSFATDEDWETVCEEVGADPDTTQSIKLYIAEADIEEEED